jgi:hypothetical protein
MNPEKGGVSNYEDAFVSDELEGIVECHDAASEIIDILPCSAV